MLDTRVSDTSDSIRRRRKCTSCDKRFTTAESVELRMPQVVKSNGTRINFDIEKIRSGFAKALHKRFVPTEYVDASIGRITSTVAARGEREIASRELGELVMAELYALDKVAYIRFASVYRSFKDVDDFRSVIREFAPQVLKRGAESEKIPAAQKRPKKAPVAPKNVE